VPGSQSTSEAQSSIDGSLWKLWELFTEPGIVRSLAARVLEGTCS
jgi:hypothetical protein